MNIFRKYDRIPDPYRFLVFITCFAVLWITPILLFGEYGMMIGLLLLLSVTIPRIIYIAFGKKTS